MFDAVHNVGVVVLRHQFQFTIDEDLLTSELTFALLAGFLEVDGLADDGFAFASPFEDGEVLGLLE